MLTRGRLFRTRPRTQTTLAPGAVDNGSGSVGVMVLAEQFARFEFENTIDFVLFGGEEQGLHGSREYVRLAQQVCVVFFICSVFCTDEMPLLTVQISVFFRSRELLPGRQPRPGQLRHHYGYDWLQQRVLRRHD